MTSCGGFRWRLDCLRLLFIFRSGKSPCRGLQGRWLSRRNSCWRSLRLDVLECRGVLDDWMLSERGEMRHENPTDGRPPVAVSVLVIAGVAALVAGAVGLLVISGPAILLDLAASAAAFVCL